MTQIGRLRPFPGWVNALIIWFQQGDPKGKYAFYQYLSKHFSDRYVQYNIESKHFFIPVDEWCFWLEHGPQNYYLDEFEPFCDLLNRIGDFTLFDLGADIGTVSALVARKCPSLQQIIAFEPNPGAYALLEQNLMHTGILSTAVNQAVSDFTGRVSFATENTLTGDHNGHILPDEAGDTPVTTIDSWLSDTSVEVQQTVVLKIDVEGQEIQAVNGAAQLLEQAKSVVVLLEIHPDVLSAHQQQPEDLFKAIEDVLPLHWFVPKFQQVAINRQAPFFEQFPVQQYDVIGLSADLAPLLHQQ